jgi:hypothetical protein
LIGGGLPVLRTLYKRMEQLPEAFFDFDLMDVWKVDANHPLRIPLINGDPTHGWHGDVDLDLYFRYTSDGTQWSIWRITGDHADARHKVVSSQPGKQIRPDVLRGLAARDSRNGFDAVESHASWRNSQKEAALQQLHELSAEMGESSRRLQSKWTNGLKSAHR